MSRFPAKEAKEIFEKHWNEGASRIGLAKQHGLSEIELIDIFEEYQEPIRADGIVYEHEFTNMAGQTLTSDGDTITSDPFYCYGFGLMSIMISLRKVGTLDFDYLHIELEQSDMNKKDWFLVKDGQLGWLYESEYNLPSKLSYLAALLSPFLRSKITAYGASLDSSNYFVVDYFKGFFK